MSKKSPTRAGRLRPDERRERNRQIAKLKSDGLSFREIAQGYGIAERTARRGAADAARLAAEETGRDLDTDRLLWRIVGVQERALDALESLLSKDADNDSALVGAARAAGPVGEALRQSLAALGLVPGRVVPDGGAAVRVDRELRSATHALVDAAERAGLDPRDLWDVERPATIQLKGAAA